MVVFRSSEVNLSGEGSKWFSQYSTHRLVVDEGVSFIVLGDAVEL